MADQLDRPVARRPALTGGEAVLAGLVAAVWGLTVATVALALLGTFLWPLTLLCGGACGIFFYRKASISPRMHTPSVVWIAAVAVAVGSALFNGAHPAEHLVGGRDGATYVTTGAWLASQGGLLIEAEIGPFTDTEELLFDFPGFYSDRSDGRLSPQFVHGYPSLMALAIQLRGLKAGLGLNAVLGGLALLLLFGVARMFVRPWLAVAAEAALALNMTFVYFSRAPYSEMLALVFVLGGIWLVGKGESELSPDVGLAGGFLVGAVVLARIDGLVLLIPMGFLALVRRRRTTADRSFWNAVLTGSLGVAALGLIDVVMIDPQYLSQLKAQLIPLLVVMVGGLLVSMFWPRAFALSIPVRYLNRLGWLAFSSVVGFSLYAYFIRPGFGEVVRLLDGPAEQVSGGVLWSAHWLTWYIGPGIVLAVLGWATTAREFVLRLNPKAALFVAAFSMFTVVYLWRPSITPDHIWAMRRYLPVVLPGTVILAVWAVDRFLGGRHRVPLQLRFPISAVAVAALLVAPLAISWPTASVSELQGLTADLETACARLGPDAAGIVVESDADEFGWVVAMPLRTVCGIPVATTRDSSILSTLAKEWEKSGRVLWEIKRGPASQDGLQLFDGDYEFIELTYDRAPAGVDRFLLQVSAEPVR